MQKFLEEYGVEHGQSSPYNPRSNGHAERNVQLIKDLLIKTGNDLESEEYIDGLAQIRNTPRADGFSPNQVVFGRSVRTLVPSLAEVLGTNECIESSRKKKTENDLKRKLKHDLTSKDHKELNIGDRVWVQNKDTRKWDDTARIVDHPRPRTYQLEMSNGKTTHRNRKFIRKCEFNGDTSANDEAGDVENNAMEDGSNKVLRRSKRLKKSSI